MEAIGRLQVIRCGVLANQLEVREKSHTFTCTQCGNKVIP